MNILVVINDNDIRESVTRAVKGRSDYLAFGATHDALDWLKSFNEGNTSGTRRIPVVNHIICDELKEGENGGYWVVMAALSSLFQAPVTLITSDEQTRREAGPFNIHSFIGVEENMAEALQSELALPTISRESEV